MLHKPHSSLKPVFNSAEQPLASLTIFCSAEVSSIPCSLSIRPLDLFLTKLPEGADVLDGIAIQRKMP